MLSKDAYFVEAVYGYGYPAGGDGYVEGMSFF